MLCPYQPVSDLRKELDQMYAVRTAEWNGFNPIAFAGNGDFIADEYR